jgi:hypothetical protein
MRNVALATIAVVAGLALASMLGVADAESPTSATTTSATAAPVRTVSVEGVATVPIAQGASLATATSVYREGMSGAIADGLGKAEFLAGKAGATLGGVQSIAEGGGSINCADGEEGDYVEYEGKQPDFGSTTASVTPIEAAAAPATPTIRKPAAKRRKKRHPTAKKASATVCTLSTQVSLAYAIT